MQRLEMSNQKKVEILFQSITFLEYFTIGYGLKKNDVCSVWNTYEKPRGEYLKENEGKTKKVYQ